MSLTSHSRVGKIHVAPCSCELHVRIRELEAELDRTHPCAMGRCLCPHDSIIIQLESRAQDAEETCILFAESELNMKARAEKAEARVAELERELALANTPDGLEREAD